MTRLALLSDIHANLSALESVLRDVRRHADLTGIYHLGDLVGYGPSPNETVALLRDAEIPGIAGNYDSTVAADYKHCGCKYEDPRQEELSHQSYEWTRRHVTPETKRHLGALPFRIDIRPFGGHVGKPTLILVHGTPTLNTVYWDEDRPDSFCLKMAAVAGAHGGDMIAFGHTHKPWHREVAGIHFVNTGSVGRPKDGDWRAGYVLVHVSDDGLSPEFVRVEYDIDKTVRGIHETDLPNELAEYLRTGGRLASISGTP